MVHKSIRKSCDKQIIYGALSLFSSRRAVPLQQQYIPHRIKQIHNIIHSTITIRTFIRLNNRTTFTIASLLSCVPNSDEL